ncbi:NUDIX hydrolase [Fodinicola acaciae]|uniref:NUDIX hydrolase n=1 Tax=Fodinicola acaciae TaxID=2681555 RepID=UPI001C9E7276|nr:NUDIX hydrolase [Fodinicola acaciae]
MDESQWRTLMVASGLVVRRGRTPAGDRLLLVRQCRASGERWECPGGGQEPGEPLERTAAREVDEEAGVPVSAGVLVCSYLLVRPHRRRNSLGAFFVAEATDPSVDPVTRVPEEITDVAYVDPLALPAEEIGPVTSVVIERWWPHRRDEWTTPFHVTVERTADGYRRLV